MTVVRTFVACFVLAFVDAKRTENLELYFRGHDAAYEGLPVLLFCKVYNSGLKVAQIIRPDREVVLECQDLLYYYKCWKRRLGYEHNYKWIFDISMNITSFRPKIDSGIWRCRNKETGEEATLEVKTNKIFIVVRNLLPEQKNYSEGYLMAVWGTNTYPNPECSWKIMDTDHNEVNKPPQVQTAVFQSNCPFAPTEYNVICCFCHLHFDRTPGQFINKYLVFSVDITHPSLRKPLHAQPTPVLYFPLIYVKILTKVTYPQLDKLGGLVCIVTQPLEHPSGRGVDGVVRFYRLNAKEKWAGFAGVRQVQTGCMSVDAPPGYDIQCGNGTRELRSFKKYYTFVIQSVKQEDFTWWSCRHETSKKRSNKVVLQPYKVLLTLSTTNTIPPRNTKVDLICKMLQGGSIDGMLGFYTRHVLRGTQRFASVVQVESGCTDILVPAGYEIICGRGTDDVESLRKVYTLRILNVDEDDYTRWFCYHLKADVKSNAIFLLQSNFMMVLSVSDAKPLLDETVFLICLLYQRVAQRTGHMEFYRRENKQPRKIAYVNQKKKSCTPGSSPSGYVVICGNGTDNVMNEEKLYNLKILGVQADDFTRWYCYHAVVRQKSNEIRIGGDGPDSPEHFSGAIGGGIIAVIVIAALMAAAVPAAAAAMYAKKRRNKNKKKKKKKKKKPKPMLTEHAEHTDYYSTDSILGSRALAKRHDINESDFWPSFFTS